MKLVYGLGLAAGLGRPFTGAWIETDAADLRRILGPVAPSRGRGLKPLLWAAGPWAAGRPFTGAWIETLPQGNAAMSMGSRPFTGAWIETQYNQLCRSHLYSRPFTGAWIETSSAQPQVFVNIVAPSRGRGLKLVTRRALIPRCGRPFTGAWIETRSIMPPPSPP